MKTMRLKAIGLTLAIAIGVGVGACNLEPSVPGAPGYEVDIKPILDARCVRCHAYPYVANAFPGIRLDLYDCSSLPDAGSVCQFGAKDKAERINIRVHGKGLGVQMPPPPAALLSPYQVDTIEKWFKAGAPP
jgi:hypothetical protein